MLDACVAAPFELGGAAIDVRFGKHVLDRGEHLLPERDRRAAPGLATDDARLDRRVRFGVGWPMMNIADPGRPAETAR